MVNFGNMSIADLRLGASQVKAAYFGSKQIWGGEEPGPVGDWLCFTAEQANSQVWFKSGGQTRYFETSTDGQNWSAYTLDTHISLPNIGDKVYFRAATGQTNTKVGNTWSGGTAFAGSGKLAASGDIKYLVSQDGNTSGIVNSCCGGLFKNMTALTKAPDIGIMNPTEECFNNAFSGCSSLEVPPRTLPATSLAKSCYQYMFQGCSSLTTAPELPATTLVHSCYSGMFSGCSSLLAAPALPATTLVPYGYRFMFENCSSLTSVPSELPATTLNQNCYEGLFKNCTSLTSAPALPATTLASNCYESMFQGCTSLTAAPALPAETLTSNCYINMLSGCSNIASIDVGFSAWNPTNATTNWVTNVAATGTFTCPAELPDTRGTSNIPTGWTVAHPVVATPLCFTAAGSNASVQLVHGNQAPSVSLETSTDGKTWTSYSNEVISLPDAGDKVYFRATDVNGAFYASSIMNWEARYANYFDCSNVVVSGKLVSIFRKDMDESSMATPAYLAKNLFRNYNNRQTQIVDASGLEIPDKTYGVMAFQGAFSNSTLSAAPAFPGDTQIYCEQYAWLYENCTKLSSLPGNCLPGSPLTAFSTDGGRTGYGWYERIAGTLPLTSDLSVVVSDAASIPSYVFYNIFDTNSPFTGTFIIDMTSYTSVPTIQSNTFNNDTKPPRGSLEIRVPASLYDTWKNTTNWTTWSSYLVPVPSGYPMQDLKLHFDAIDNAGVGNHLASTQDWANIAPDTSADYKLHRTTGSWEDDSAVFTGQIDECFWLNTTAGSQVANFSQTGLVLSSQTYEFAFYFDPSTCQNYRGYVGKQSIGTGTGQIYIACDSSGQVNVDMVGKTASETYVHWWTGDYGLNMYPYLTENAFNTIAVTWDEATTVVTLYVNGQKIGDSTAPNGIIKDTVLKEGLTLGGGMQSSRGNRVCKGKIYDFLVYSRALSDAEVAQLHDYQDARFNS